ncbi:MAG: hypothetical protein JSV73_09240 [Flavobacteriaceae bacterium]|nr:MAG: hypothetical protein JSV73_09240 [Flavobacteriaceae bacterium]
MLHFFRKIRRELLAKSQFFKYLKYAVGEIVLVVLGILIALSINNWNERNKERRVEDEYLERISLDIQKDIDYLEGKIRFTSINSESFQLFIEEMHRIQRTRQDMIRLISSVNWDAQNILIQDKTYAEIISSGKLSMISQKRLKESIDEYYRNCKRIQQHISEMSQTGINLFLPVYTITLKYYDVYSFYDNQMYHDSNWEFINDPTSKDFRELEGAAGYYYWKHLNYNKYCEELLKEAEDLSYQLQRNKVRNP